MVPGRKHQVESHTSSPRMCPIKPTLHFLMSPSPQIPVKAMGWMAEPVGYVCACECVRQSRKARWEGAWGSLLSPQEKVGKAFCLTKGHRKEGRERKA